MEIAVGSQNPLKLRSVKEVLEKIYPEATYLPVKVDPGVSPTPLDNDETIAGARQRAQMAYNQTGADWGIGLEGGMTRIDRRWFTCVWCVIRDGSEETLGGGVHFELPARVIRSILQEGMEMGTRLDEITGISMSKRKMGAEGILTGGLIDRAATFKNAILYALAPRISAEYYRCQTYNNGPGSGLFDERENNFEKKDF